MFLLALPAFAGAPLTVTVHGAASDVGAVMCQVFRSPEGFPDQDPKAVAYSAGALRNGSATCSFPALPAGRLAVAVYHDADGDTHLDTNRLGLPAEAYGFSNGAKAGWFGPPSWEEAAVTLGDTPLTLRVELSR